MKCEDRGPDSLVRRARRATSVPGALVVGGVLAGVALRVWIVRSSLGALDSDEAVWGLMARHFRHGEVSTFFWGQTYGGTLEVFLTVPVFWVFGAGATALRAVPLVLWAVSAVLVWRIGRRTLDENRAQVAAILYWTWSPYFLWKSTRAHGFYGSGLVVGLGAVLLALRLRERDSGTDYALFGMALGVGWWATPQTVMLGLPAVAWLIWTRPAALRGAWLALSTFALGSLPWWLFNVRHGWTSLHQQIPDATSRPEHLRSLLSTTLPTALGLRLPFSLAWLLPVAVGVLVYALVLAGFVYLVYRRPPGLGLPLLTAVAFPVIYAASSYTWFNTEPRYVTFAYPIVALLLASLATSRPRIIALAAATLAVAVGGVAEMEHHRLGASHADGATVPADIHPLLRTLGAHGINRVYANYWVAFRITFESNERIIAAPVGDAGQQRYAIVGRRVVPLSKGRTGSWRYRKFNHEVAATTQAAHVLVGGTDLHPTLDHLLLTHGYSRLSVGGFNVYLPPTLGDVVTKPALRAPLAHAK